MPAGVAQRRVDKGASNSGQWTVDGRKVWAEGLSHEQRGALAGYSTTNYGQINKSLREGSTHPDVELIDEAIKMAPPIDEDLEVFRGMVLQGPPQVGTILADRGYVSTSTDLQIAAQHHRAAVIGRDPGSVAVVSIVVPRGTRVASMPHVLRMGRMDDREKEILLPRNSRFQIRKVERHESGVYKLWVDLIP